MRGKYSISFLLLTTLFLASCSFNDKNTSNSETTKSSTKLTMVDDDIEEKAVEEEERSTVNIEIDTSSLIDDTTNQSYKVPASLSAYVGTYKGESPEDANSGEPAKRVELKINEDGTFYKLVRTAQYKEAGMDSVTANNIKETTVGYFDSSGIYQRKGNGPTIAGEKYRLADQFTFSRGVVLEKFDKLYFVEFEWTKISEPQTDYIDSDGQIDIVKTLFAPILKGYWEEFGPNGTMYRLALSDSGIKEFFNNYLVNQTTRLTIWSDLESLDSISNGKVVASKVPMEKTNDVHKLISGSLSDIVNEKFLRSIVQSENDLYQISQGSYIDTNMNLGSPEGDVRQYQKLTNELNAKIYDATGSSITPEYGYYTEDVDGKKQITIMFDNTVYASVREEDGVFIINK